MGVMENILEAGRAEKGASVPVAMTIAGSDSGGGAGIQADLKTFAANEVHGASVLTLVTAQNTRKVHGIETLPPGTIRAQYEAVVTDLAPSAAKTGALGDVPTLRTVAGALDDHPIEQLVVDPVLISKHGDPLMADDGFPVMREQMVPGATLVTPNHFEAEVLSGRSVGGVDTMKEAAKQIHDLGAEHVLIKGSHLDRIVRDILYDGSGFIEFGADKISTENLHGSGCVFSAAIVARLAHGQELPEAIGFAREFITEAIQGAVEVGEGINPVNPMVRLWN